MSPDVFLKRFFTPIVATLLAATAYLQASGVTQLVATSTLAVEEKDLTGDFGASTTGKSAKAEPFRKSKSAQPIIDRNPFDSVTGPLKPALEVPDVTKEVREERLDLSDPLNAPMCEGLKVNIVTESTDPLWSVTHIKGPTEQHGELRRVGDAVETFEIQFIGYNPAKLSPAVWLTKGGTTLCQALLFPVEEVPPAKAAPAPAAAAPAAPEAPAPATGVAKVSKEIQDKIQVVSPTEVNVDRSVIDHVLENQATLMRSARIVPEQKDGKTVGIRLFGIRPDTMLGVLGLQNGDRLETINGYNMSSPETALQAYARLRTASNLSVQITRRGKPMKIEFKIK